MISQAATAPGIGDPQADDFRPLRRAAHLPGPLVRATREQLVRRSRPRRGKGLPVAAACAFAATAAAALAAGSALPGLAGLQDRLAISAEPPARVAVASVETPAMPVAAPATRPVEPMPERQAETPAVPAPEIPAAYAVDPNLPVGPLLAKARSLIAVGDVGGARRLAERAASGGAPEALFVLAELHDPAKLAEWRVFGVRPDAARAKALYGQAGEKGDARAAARIAALR